MKKNGEILINGRLMIIKKKLEKKTHFKIIKRYI